MELKNIALYIIFIYGILTALVLQIIIGYYFISNADCYCRSECTDNHYLTVHNISDYTRTFTKNLSNLKPSDYNVNPVNEWGEDYKNTSDLLNNFNRSITTPYENHVNEMLGKE